MKWNYSLIPRRLFRDDKTNSDRSSARPLPYDRTSSRRTKEPWDARCRIVQSAGAAERASPGRFRRVGRDCPVEDISTLLVKTGFRVTKLGIGRKLAALNRQLTVCRPDVVFNLFEGRADRPETEIMVARLLERLQIPFTGSSSKSLWLSLNKHLAKRRFRAGGIPMPRFRVTNEVR